MVQYMVQHAIKDINCHTIGKLSMTCALFMAYLSSDQAQGFQSYAFLSTIYTCTESVHVLIYATLNYKHNN